MFLLPLIQLAAVLYVNISLTSQRLEVLRQIKCMRISDSPETSIYLFIYLLFIIYLSFCKLVQKGFYQVYIYIFLRLGYSGTFVLPFPPPLPPPSFPPSGGLVTVILIENEQVIKQVDDFIVVSNTHHDNHKVFLVIITEAPYNRMFANEKPVSQMVFSLPYRQGQPTTIFGKISVRKTI